MQYTTLGILMFIINFKKKSLQLLIKITEITVYKTSLPIHRGPFNFGLHARQVPSTMSQ